MAAGNEDRLYDPQSGDTDLLEDQNFDYRTAGARLLGRDIVPLLNTETKSLVSRVLDEAPTRRIHGSTHRYRQSKSFSGY